jgi:uncharacterized protein (TIGR03437 family)
MLKILTLFVLAAAACVSLLPTARGEITILAVTSSPSFAVGLPGPGSLASVFCTGLTGIQGIEVAQGNPLPRTLAGIRVTVGAIDAPILAVADFGSYQQINFQVPWETSTGPSLVISQDASSARMDNVLPSPFGGFFMDAARYAVVQHAVDFQLVTPDNPARPGEWVVAYASNLGPVTSPQLTGVPAAADPLARIAPGSPGPWQFTVWLSQPSGFVSAESNFMGLTPGSVGLYQVNFKLPDHLAPGDHEFYFQRLRDCGFFFVQGCGRGVTMDSTPMAKLHGQLP